MKALIQAGKFSKHLAEATIQSPKTMVEMGRYHVLRNDMNIYIAYARTRFVFALCYLVEFIKSYFLNLYVHTNNISTDLSNHKEEVQPGKQINWKFYLTCVSTQTYGYIRHLESTKNFPSLATVTRVKVDIPAILKNFLEKQQKLQQPQAIIGTEMREFPTVDFGKLIARIKYVYQSLVMKGIQS